MFGTGSNALHTSNSLCPLTTWTVDLGSMTRRDQNIFGLFGFYYLNKNKKGVEKIGKRWNWN